MLTGWMHMDPWRYHLKNRRPATNPVRINDNNMEGAVDCSFFSTKELEGTVLPEIQRLNWIHTRLEDELFRADQSDSEQAWY